MQERWPTTIQEYIELEGYKDLGHDHAFRFTSWRPDRRSILSTTALRTWATSEPRSCT